MEAGHHPLWFGTLWAGLSWMAYWKQASLVAEGYSLLIEEGLSYL